MVAMLVSREAPQARRLGSVTVTLVVLQIAAGLLNLSLLAPIWMQLVHLLLADLLWIALVLFSAAALEETHAFDDLAPAVSGQLHDGPQL